MRCVTFSLLLKYIDFFLFDCDVCNDVDEFIFLFFIKKSSNLIRSNQLRSGHRSE